MDWFLNVTLNDISVIYVTADWCARWLKKKKLDLLSGFHATDISYANNVAEKVRTITIPFSLVVHTYSVLSLSIHYDGIRSRVGQGAPWLQ